MEKNYLKLFMKVIGFSLVIYFGSIFLAMLIYKGNDILSSDLSTIIERFNHITYLLCICFSILFVLLYEIIVKLNKIYNAIKKEDKDEKKKFKDHK